MRHRPQRPRATTAGDHRRGEALLGQRRRRETNREARDVHPKYYEAKVHCGSCGTEWTVGSTRPELRVDVCANCHPFFTGTQNIIDTAGQVERFQKRLERQARRPRRSSTSPHEGGSERARLLDSRHQTAADAYQSRGDC